MLNSTTAIRTDKTANYVYEAIYFDKDAGWSTFNVTFKDVEESEILAWMPLPEPYKEESGEQSI